jgi:hypothetical protein
MNFQKLWDFYVPYPWKIYAQILFFTLPGALVFWYF